MRMRLGVLVSLGITLTLVATDASDWDKLIVAGSASLSDVSAG